MKGLPENEAIALIHYYGRLIADASGGAGGATRSDVMGWAERVRKLAHGLPSRAGNYLCDED